MKIEELQTKGYLPRSAFLQRLAGLVEKIQRSGWLTGSLFWTTTLALIGFAVWRKSEWLLLGICLLMLYLSYWCYASQRWKMTQAAYLYFVLLSMLPPDDKDDKKVEKKSLSND